MKNDDNLIDRLINDDNSENDMIKELSEELDREMNKPYEDIDYEKVAELSSVITETSGGMPEQQHKLDIIIEQYASENIPSALTPPNQNEYYAITAYENRF